MLFKLNRTSTVKGKSKHVFHVFHAYLEYKYALSRAHLEYVEYVFMF